MDTYLPTNNSRFARYSEVASIFLPHSTRAHEAAAAGRDLKARRGLLDRHFSDLPKSQAQAYGQEYHIRDLSSYLYDFFIAMHQYVRYFYSELQCSHVIIGNHRIVDGYLDFMFLFIDPIPLSVQMQDRESDTISAASYSF